MNQEYNSGFTEPLQQKKSLPAAPLTLLLGINHTVKQCREKIERLNQDDKKKKRPHQEMTLHWSDYITLEFLLAVQMQTNHYARKVCSSMRPCREGITR